MYKVIADGSRVYKKVMQNYKDSNAVAGSCSDRLWLIKSLPVRMVFSWRHSVPRHKHSGKYGPQNSREKIFLFTVLPPLSLVRQNCMLKHQLHHVAEFTESDPTKTINRRINLPICWSVWIHCEATLMVSLCGSHVHHTPIRLDKLPRLLVLSASEAFDSCGTGFTERDYQ